MRPAPPSSHLSESQSSLASETGTSSADPQPGTPPWPDPKSPGEYQAAPADPLPSAPPRPSSLPQLAYAAECYMMCVILCFLSTVPGTGGTGVNPTLACDE